MVNKFYGLTDQEAGLKLISYGFNEIREIHHHSALQILLRQVKENFIIYLLLAATLLSLFVGKFITAGVLVAVIFAVVIAGFVQEFKAEKAIAALKKMIMPISLVIRSGREQELPSREIVPGDILLLRSGERIPADCLLLEGRSVKVNEAVLSGESAEVSKTPFEITKEAYSEENMLFMGSFIVNGRCVARALHTGMNTRFGKIAGMISQAEKAMPLQKKVNKISKFMVAIAISVSSATGILLFFQSPEVNFDTFTNILITVIAISVSAFPEGFPVVLISTLAIGVSRMAKQNAIVNRMSIVETLGETTIICSDKTGTITKGEMTVNKIFADNRLFSVTGVGYESTGQIFYNNQQATPSKDSTLYLAIKAGVVCNDAHIGRTGEDKVYQVIGSGTEGSLLILGAKAGIFVDDLSIVRASEIPFSSERKMMSVLAKEEGKMTVYLKGAPEMVLKKTSFIRQEGKIFPLSDKMKEDILKVNRKMTVQALRTLILAYKEVEDVQYDEDNATFLALVGMEDPPRDEIKDALLVCKNAGIKVKMITGDARRTAETIANQIGLVGDCCEGDKLDQLSDEELKKSLDKIALFVRVRPEHKLRIVKLLKQRNEIVTMTGDGVNDAPALKEAHIGVAMGIAGTDVSRSVADITLKDDNFATIVVAIREGRAIFNNVRKFVTYQLSCNFSELIVIFIGVLFAPLLGWQAPLLTALQILFMNLVTDNLPAITLSLTPTSKDIMNHGPRRKTNILTKSLISVIFFNGALMGAFTLLIYFISFNLWLDDVKVARTTALVGLILMEIGGAFHFRSFRYRVFNRGIFVNPYLVYASLISLLATIFIVYSVAQRIFETTALSTHHWLLALTFAYAHVVILDILKTINNKTHALLKDVA